MLKYNQGVLRKKVNRYEGDTSGNISELSFQIACDRDGDANAGSSDEEVERIQSRFLGGRQASAAHSLSHLRIIKDGLKACKNETGFLNPQSAFDRLNEIQRHEDPEAYQPELEHALIVKLNQDRERKQKLEAEARRREEREYEKLQHEKALFDFDEDVNDLDIVEERYPLNVNLVELEE